MYSNLNALFNSIAILLTFIAFAPYIYAIIRGDTKPHAFSWLIWSITTIIVFFAQVEGKGGIGAWSTAVSGVITAVIALLAWLKHADSTITRVDWLFLLAALASLPVWYFTSDPLWAVIMLTLVDLLGFGPTIRKAYALPYEENYLFFWLFIVRNGVAILALEHYSITTVLFPFAVSVASLMLLILIGYRRKVLAAPM